MKKVLMSAAISAICVSALTADKVFEDFEKIDGWKKGRHNPSFELTEDAAEGKKALKVTLPGNVYKDRIKFNWKKRLDWDKKYKGISFKVKGDGSGEFASLWIGNSPWGWRYGFYFPVKNKDWKEYRISWEDFTPAGSITQLFNSPSALPPSGIAFIQLGDRWKIAEKNRKIKPFSFVVDDLKLIEEVEPVYEKGKYKAGKLDNALKNLKTGGTFTLFCTGDSITAGSGLRKPDSDRYAVVLQKKLREHFKDAEVKVECKGVGGARVEDLIGWTERDFSEEIPDALTIMIGYNNKSGALPGSGFKKKLNEYIDRVIAKTKGKTAIILIPTIPGRGNRFDMMDDYADAVREIAKERGLPVCDVQKTFKGMGKIKIAEYLADRAHPNPAGHKIFADKIAEFIIEKAGK